MRIRSKLLVGLGVALVAAGCDDLTTPAPAALEPAAGVAAGARFQEAEASLRQVARAVAVALQQEDVRLAVRDAMRDSPWDVHQVSLREYLAGARGRLLLEAAARAAGETPEAFGARVAALPDLDFYVPSRIQRRTWKGTPGVVVAAAINPESGEVAGFGPNGQPVPNALGGGAAERPLMLLHPAEPRGRRSAPQPAGAGEVIQSAEDGEKAVSYAWVDANGKRTEIDLDGGAEGFMPVLNTFGDSTYLDAMEANFGDPGDDLEIVLTAKFYHPDGTYLGEAVYSNYSFPKDDLVPLHFPLLRPVLPDSSLAYISVRIKEDDADEWGNPNDYFGPRVFSWVDRGQLRAVNNENNDGSRLDVELDWVQRSPSVRTSVQVYGVEMALNESRGTSAQSFDQYGLRMTGSVSGWSTGNTSVATVSGGSNNTATVYAQGVGSTYVYATIGGITGSGEVTVMFHDPNCDPNLDPFCPM